MSNTINKKKEIHVQMVNSMNLQRGLISQQVQSKWPQINQINKRI